MPALVIPQTIDTISTNATCKYPAAPLGGAPLVSPTIFIGKKPATYYVEGTFVNPVVGTPLIPIIPCVIPIGIRTIKTTVNQSIYFNKLKPALQGDEAFIAGTPRPLKGPFDSPRVQYQTGRGAASP